MLIVKSGYTVIPRGLVHSEVEIELNRRQIAGGIYGPEKGALSLLNISAEYLSIESKVHPLCWLLGLFTKE